MATLFISASMSDRARLHNLRAPCVAIFCGLAAACVSVPPRLVAPEIRAAEVRVVVFDFPQVRLAVDLTVYNPNAGPIALEGLDVALHVEGRPVARTTLATPVTLAPGSATPVVMDASGHLGAALAGVARSLDRGSQALRYEIEGTARLADGSQFPFRRAGVLAYR
jgi:LEA14-like dessication related protein